MSSLRISKLFSIFMLAFKKLYISYIFYLSLDVKAVKNLQYPPVHWWLSSSWCQAKAKWCRLNREQWQAKLTSVPGTSKLFSTVLVLLVLNHFPTLHSSKCSLCYCSVASVMSNSLGPPGTVARQTPLSMGFSRQEYWSGVPFPSPGRLPNPGTKPVSPALQVDLLLLSHQGSQYLKDAWEKWMLKKQKLNGSMKTYRTF